MKKILILLLLGAVFIIGGCDGDDGKKGLTGETGVMGITGPSGLQGVTGCNAGETRTLGGLCVVELDCDGLPAQHWDEDNGVCLIEKK